MFWFFSLLDILQAIVAWALRVVIRSYCHFHFSRVSSSLNKALRFNMAIPHMVVFKPFFVWLLQLISGDYNEHCTPTAFSPHRCDSTTHRAIMRNWHIPQTFCMAVCCITQLHKDLTDAKPLHILRNQKTTDIHFYKNVLTNKIQFYTIKLGWLSTK